MDGDNDILGVDPRTTIIDKDIFDKKVGDITVRQLVEIMVMIKKGRNPRWYKRSGIRDRIIDIVTKNPNITSYEIAKLLDDSYDLTKYHVKAMIDDGILESEDKMEKIGDRFVRKNLVRMKKYETTTEQDNSNDK